MLALAGCGGPLASASPEHLSTTTDAGLQRPSHCGTDADCPSGMLCEGCGDGYKTCVPGCRENSQCGPFQVCFMNVQCLTCPCPSGFCDLDPCRDFDGDGYVAATDVVCPGKLPGDCDDTRAWVHPGVKERCSNGLDDDCDGRTDARDSDCAAQCAAGSRRCNTSADCGSQNSCEAGCCTACPRLVDPVCGPDECVLSGGLSPNGCFAPNVCGACRSCGTSYAPVCGSTYATYTNACHAAAAGAKVLHDGECLTREGHACQHQIDCRSSSLFCREVAPGDSRCSKVGTCSTDADCELVTAVVPCGDAGLAPWTCREQRCNARCE